MIHHNSAIQEGVLRDIVELLSDNVNGFIDPGDTDSFIGKLLNSRNTGNYFRSITKATSNLVLTFPMIVDNSVSIETASMVSKAVEKKIVLMLQMLFSAISVTNNKDAFDFVSKIHKNLTSDDVLSYINKMDSIPYRESSTLDFDQINKDLVRLIKEDSSRELSYDLRPALESRAERRQILDLQKERNQAIAQRDRYADYLKKFTDNTQFLVITHRKGTMEAADTVYGVTMEENGISKLLSMKLA